MKGKAASRSSSGNSNNSSNNHGNNNSGPVQRDYDHAPHADLQEIKKSVNRDGTDARNVLNWWIDADDNGNSSKSHRDARRATKRRNGSNASSNSSVTSKTSGSVKSKSKKHRAKKRNNSRAESGKGRRQQDNLTEQERAKVKAFRRQQKLWSILFSNVNRSIDELYYVCEYERYCKFFHTLF